MGRAAAGAVHRLIAADLKLLDEVAVSQFPHEHGGRPPGQAELPGELGAGPDPAAVVDRPEQARQIVRAQVRTGRRSFDVEWHPLIVSRPCATYRPPHRRVCPVTLIAEILEASYKLYRLPSRNGGHEPDTKNFF